MTTVRLIGREGPVALAAALADAGFVVGRILDRGGVRPTPRGVDVLRDRHPGAVAEVAAAAVPVPATVVVHLSGALTLDVLAPHRRRASAASPSSPCPPPRSAAFHLRARATSPWPVTPWRPRSPGRSAAG